MGHAESSQEKQLVRDRDPSEWIILDSRRDCQVWQSKTNRKKYMAYPIDLSQSDSEQHLQMYHFRKLNHVQFVTPEMILKNQNDSLCSATGTVHLLLEYLPARLGDLNKLLSFQDRLIILTAIFRGLQTLNFVYGPILLSEDMVAFNQHGQTKIWVNQLFSSNQPSPFAKTSLSQSSSERLSRSRTSAVQEAMFNCVTEAFRVVGNWEVQTYPPDFRIQAAKIKTFSQGQQFISNFCWQKKIELTETVPFWKYIQNRQSRSKSYEENFSFHQPLLYSERSSQQSYQRKSGGQFDGAFKGNRPISLEQSIVRQHHFGINPLENKFQPNASSASNKVRISYGYNSQRVQLLPHQNKLPTIHIPSPVPVQLVNSTHQKVQVRPLGFQQQNNFTFSKEQKKMTPWKEEVSTLPLNTIVSEEVVPDISTKNEWKKQQREITFKEINNTSPFIKEKSIRKNQKQNSQISISPQKDKASPQKSGQNAFGNNSEPAVPDLPIKNNSSESPLNMMKSSYSDNTSVNIMDDLKMWEASMLMKISNKRNTQIEADPASGFLQADSESVEEIPLQNKQKSKELLSVEEMEAYVRQKYGQQMISPQQTKVMKKVSTGSFENHHELYSFGPGFVEYNNQEKSYDAYREVKSSGLFKNFRNDSKRQRRPSCQNRVEEPVFQQPSYETSKYTTFGKIDTDPLGSYTQVNNFQTNYKAPSSRRPAKSSYTKIDQKYNKYVVNRTKRDPMPSKAGQFFDTSFETKRQKMKTYVDYIRQSPSSANTNRLLESSEKGGKTSYYDNHKGKATYDKLKELLRK